MNKSELIEAADATADTTQKQTNAVLNALLEAITEAVASGEKVTIVGFGVFESRNRAARKCRNPKTNEPIAIPATVVPVFSPGKDFREAVKK